MYTVLTNMTYDGMDESWQRAPRPPAGSRRQLIHGARQHISDDMDETQQRAHHPATGGRRQLVLLGGTIYHGNDGTRQRARHSATDGYSSMVLANMVSDGIDEIRQRPPRPAACPGIRLNSIMS